MQERLHEHINLELRTNTTTDTIFMLAAISFNFMMLCLGSSAAAAAASDMGNFRVGSILVYVVTLILTLIANGLAVIGLTTGRGTRRLLSDGLLKMYKDASVDNYYDASLLTNYSRRYTLFIGIVGIMAFASFAIPLIILVFMR